MLFRSNPQILRTGLTPDSRGRNCLGDLPQSRPPQCAPWGVNRLKLKIQIVLLARKSELILSGDDVYRDLKVELPDLDSEISNSVS